MFTKLTTRWLHVYSVEGLRHELYLTPLQAFVLHWRLSGAGAAWRVLWYTLRR